MARKKATTATAEAAPAIERVPVHSVHHDPANVRKHPDRNLDAIKGSLARFGQVKPIVVDGDNIVRAGNGTLAAAVALGWQDIDIVRTPLKGSEATAYAIADNRTAELAEWDEQGLAETLRALQSEDFDLGAVGFDAAEVDAMINRLAGEIVDDPATEWEGMPEFDNPATAFQSISVHFATEDDVRAFASAVGRTIEQATKTMWFPEQPPQRPNGAAWTSAETE